MSNVNVDENVLTNVVSLIFPAHPFERVIPATVLEETLRQYTAMSQAFPHIQAGAQRSLLEHFLKRGSDIPEHVEITTAVGAFLVADETGVWNVLRSVGISGLPTILNTNGFHANLLREDLRKIYGKPVFPLYNSKTRHYLKALSDGLADPDPIVRCAWMVSFELHAERMITGLWASVAEQTTLPKEELKYFQTHVGGDDPAEAYHVAMTQGMIEKLIPQQEVERFISIFKESYSAHFEWCRQISQN